jgi:Ser/Thr protein kinase RdoA (MazF antagonist)
MTEGDVRTLVEQHDLGALHAAHEFDTPGRPWKITTSRGDYMVRQRLLSGDPGELEFEHRLAAWLDARGFHVPAPVPMHDGQTWSAVNGELLTIHHFLPGVHFVEGNAVQARNAGAALATFHKLTSDFPGGKARRPPEHFRSLERNIAAVVEAYGDREEVSSLVADSRELDAQLPCSLPHALLHNDFHPGNVLFTCDEFAAALELDFCFWGPRLSDIAQALLAFAFSFDEKPGGPAIPIFSLACARSWLAGYTTRSPLGLREKELLPLALRHRTRADALFHLRDVAEQAGKWIGHEWDYAGQQVTLVDAHCQALVGAAF